MAIFIVFFLDIFFILVFLTGAAGNHFQEKLRSVCKVHYRVIRANRSHCGKHHARTGCSFPGYPSVVAAAVLIIPASCHQLISKSFKIYSLVLDSTATASGCPNTTFTALELPPKEKTRGCIERMLHAKGLIKRKTVMPLITEQENTEACIVSCIDKPYE